MPKQTLHDFAATPEKGLPQHVPAPRKMMADGGKADGHWMERAFPKATKGALHRDMGIAQGKKIPAERLAKATHSSDPKERHRAQAAENAAGVRKRKNFGA